MKNRGCLSRSQREGIVVLVPKKTECTDIHDYRAITLLNTDYKLYAKILCTRLKPILEKVLHPGQAGIPGRSLYLSQKVLGDFVRDHQSEMGRGGGILALDWKAAFDNVDHLVLKIIMEQLGFSRPIIKWVMSLYTDASLRVQVNGKLGTTVSLHHGIRQGCPLSQILFAIYQEPLYRALTAGCEQHPCNGQCGRPIHIVGYVDDTTLMLTDAGSLSAVDRIVTTFSEATGMICNKDKSGLLLLGPWQRGPISVESPWVVRESLKICGLIHAATSTEGRVLNSKMVVDSVIRRVGMLRLHGLTLHQRVIVTNSILYAKVWHVVRVSLLCPRDETRLLVRVFRFIWGSRCCWLRRSVLSLSVRKGGLGLLDFHASMLALFVKHTYVQYLRVAGNPVSETYQYLCECVKGRDRHICVDMLRVLTVVSNPRACKLRILVRATMEADVAPVCSQFPLYAWADIWNRLVDLPLRPVVRETVYKFFHNILPSGSVLCTRQLRDIPSCSDCGIEETVFHAIYFCERLESVRCWLGRLIRWVGGGGLSPLRVLSLDVGGVPDDVERALGVLVSDFIHTSWVLRTAGTIERVHGIIAVMYRTKCRNQLLFGNRWERSFPYTYRSFRVPDLWHLYDVKT